MPTRIDQAAVIVLAVEFDQTSRQLAQQRDADRLIVDRGLRTAVRLDLALEDQRLARFDNQFGGIESGANSTGKLRELEHRRNARRLLPRAHQPAIRPVAQHQPQRIEQDRLARPGLAGEHTEAAGKFQLQRLDQDNIADGKPGEHLRRTF